jgi:hypothetical protein
MHKMDNFEELESIANNIKIYYNKSESSINCTSEKAIIFDINYLVSCIKVNATKFSEKDKDHDYFKKKVVFMIKRIIDDKFNADPS